MTKKRQIRSLVVGGAVVATFAILLVIYQPFSGLIINRPYRSLNLIKGLPVIGSEVSSWTPPNWHAEGGEGEFYLSKFVFEIVKLQAAAELPAPGYKLTHSDRDYVWWDKEGTGISIWLEDGTSKRYGNYKGKTMIECALALPNSLMTKIRLQFSPY